MKKLNFSPQKLHKESSPVFQPLFSDSGVLFKTEIKQETRTLNRFTSVKFSKMKDDENKISKTQDIQKKSSRLKMKKRLKLKIKKSIGTIQEIPTGLAETQEVGRIVDQ